MRSKFSHGDRIAYSGQFLRNTVQHAGDAPARRGTYLRSVPGGYCRVRWDDEAALLSPGVGQYADEDFRNDVRENGSFVCEGALAVIGSPAFGVR